MIEDIIRIDKSPMERTICDQRRNLQQTHLERIRRSDLHRQGDVAIHCKGNSVQKLRCIWHKRKERDAQELLVDIDVIKDSIDGIDQDLSNNGISNRSYEKYENTFRASPVGSVMPAFGSLAG